MSDVPIVWIDLKTGVRGIVCAGDPNVLGLICPAPSVAYDTVNKKHWVSQDDDTCDWAEVAVV